MKYLHWLLRPSPIVVIHFVFRTLKPVESRIVSFLSIGEGWHNYHHAFPWDYRAAELGSRYSVTTFIINMLAALGLAYDLKMAPYNMIEHRVRKKGDGTHHLFGENGFARDDEMDIRDDNDNVVEDVSEELDVRRKRPDAVKG